MFNFLKPKKEVYPTVVFWSMKSNPNIHRAVIQLNGDVLLDTGWCKYGIQEFVDSYIKENGYKGYYPQGREA